MLSDPWHLGLLVALCTANVAATYWLYRRLDGRSTPPWREADTASVTTADADPATSSAGDDGTEAVRCSACGTANDPEYRFCRFCVAELSTPGVADDGGAGAARGLSR